MKLKRINLCPSMMYKPIGGKTGRYDKKDVDFGIASQNSV